MMQSSRYSSVTDNMAQHLIDLCESLYIFIIVNRKTVKTMQVQIVCFSSKFSTATSEKTVTTTAAVVVAAAVVVMTMMMTERKQNSKKNTPSKIHAHVYQKRCFIGWACF